MMHITRFSWIQAASVLVLLMLSGGDLIAHSSKQSSETDAVAQTYATVSWPDPMNPRFVNLGADQYLLATSTGMQLWNAKQNTFSEAKDWPMHSALGTVWARLSEGSLLVAGSHNEKDMPQHHVLWWNAATQSFSRPLPLRQDMLVSDLVSIDSHHALVCMRLNKESRKSADPVQLTAQVVSLREGALRWETENSDQLQSAMLAADIRGPVEGMGNTGGASTETLPPVIFNTQTCQWEMKALPENMRDAQKLYIKHYRLPDGRILIGQADWYSPAQGHIETLAAPLLWNAASGQWEAIDNTAQDGDDVGMFRSYGINDPVVSVTTVDAEFVEFLDPKTLHWIRSRQKLPQTYGPRLAPLSTGQAIAFLSERGQILLLDPIRAYVPGRFLYNHYRLGEVRLGRGGLLLTGGGTQWDPSNRPEIIKPPYRITQPIPPLPKPLGFLSGIELPDQTILVFGGLPPRCSPSSFGSPCGNLPAQASYRYFPSKNRWEPVPGLSIHFASGQFGRTGDSDITSQWPRNDTLLRRNGDFVYLDSGNTLGLQDNEVFVTTLIRWHPGISPQPMAHLSQGRLHATLIELADARLAVIGGEVRPSPLNPAEPLQFAPTTEIFNDKVNEWVTGPRPNYAGGRAVKLANGRVFKLSMKNWYVTNGYQAEVADAAFTRWKKLPEFPLKEFNVMDMMVVGNRVYILPDEPYRKTVIWNDTSRVWSIAQIWNKEFPLAVTPLDSKRMLVRSYDAFKIVPIPH